MKAQNRAKLQSVYHDYLCLLQDGKTPADALDELSYLHPITLAQLKKLIIEELTAKKNPAERGASAGQSSKS